MFLRPNFILNMCSYVYYLLHGLKDTFHICLFVFPFYYST
uniref:Uncharacterized protein n=1 Tax=Anguilla anguilla TaxID=7936 RepID=A0A0E9QWN4_ANGAN